MEYLKLLNLRELLKLAYVYYSLRGGGKKVINGFNYILFLLLCKGVKRSLQEKQISLFKGIPYN